MKNPNQCAVYYSTFHAPVKPHIVQRNLAMEMLHHAFSAFFGTELQENGIKQDKNGKPCYEYLPNCFFNISHCSTAVAVAVAHAPVGVDIESPRTVKPGAVRKCCNPGELSYIFDAPFSQITLQKDLTPEQAKRFLNLWTLKESYVKMTGDGLRIPFDTVCFDIPKFQRINQNILRWTQPGQYQSYLYSQKNTVISLTLQQKPTAASPQIQWNSYPGEVIATGECI